MEWEFGSIPGNILYFTRVPLGSENWLDTAKEKRIVRSQIEPKPTSFLFLGIFLFLSGKGTAPYYE